MANQCSFTLAQNIDKKRPWIIFLAIVQILLGIFAIAFVGLTTLVSVIYLGGVLLVAGATEVAYGIRHRQHGDLWFHLLIGVLTTVCGFLILTNPVAKLLILTVVIAVLFMATGLVTLVGSLIERFDHWPWFALNGVISVAAGYLVLSNPLESSVWLIGLLVGIQMISRGVAWLSLAGAGKVVSIQLKAQAAKQG